MKREGMKRELNDVRPDDQAELLETVQFVRRRLGRLIIAVYLMTVALILAVAAVFGNLVNYFGAGAMSRGEAYLLLLGLAGFFGLVTGSLALRKNRNCWLWGLVGVATFLIGGIALACARFLCPKCRRPLTKKEWDDQRCPNCGDLFRLNEDLPKLLQSVGRRLGGLTVVVSLMALALYVTVVEVFGNLVDYFTGDVTLWGGATAGAAIGGFVFGCIARRRARVLLRGQPHRSADR